MMEGTGVGGGGEGGWKRGGVWGGGRWPCIRPQMLLPGLPPSFLSTVWEQSFGGGWQAISDVMPAVQQWQLNLFSEIPQNFYL